VAEERDAAVAHIEAIEKDRVWDADEYLETQGNMTYHLPVLHESDFNIARDHFLTSPMSVSEMNALL